MAIRSLPAARWPATRTVLMTALWAAACWPRIGTAQGAVPKEQIKAALVFNFLKFTEWPADTANAPLTLCVAGPDRKTEAAFAQVQGRMIENRTIQVRTVRGGDVAACHLLYIHDLGRDLLTHVVAGNPNLLTVGDQDDFTEAGGVIGLVEFQGRLQFKVNLDMLKRGNYKLSSQLLRLAVNMR
ncbi:MAG: YfiR family protein [Burkholderiaceae bacterium]|nr:YfiR family protein [Burkholderiaceae bacterium]